MRNRLNIIIAASLLGLLSCGREPLPATCPAVGDALPAFSVRMEKGETVTSEDLSLGRCLLVFFHTGCPDCVRELEDLQPFYDRHGAELRLVLISRSEGPESVREYWRAHGYTMPYSAQKDRRVYDLFSRSGIPYVLLVQDGVIRGIWNDRDMFSEEEYRSLVGEPRKD